jgi:hypothetical protein
MMTVEDLVMTDQYRLEARPAKTLVQQAKPKVQVVGHFPDVLPEKLFKPVALAGRVAVKSDCVFLSQAGKLVDRPVDG